MRNLNAYERLSLFLEKYGEKALMVLKAAYDISQDPNIDHRLGDFSFKHLVMRLASLGFNYNPVNMLRILERGYGIIEKSYMSSNQTWWRFTDPDAIRRVVSEHFGMPIEDPMVKALLIKYRSLEPNTILSSLRRMLAKEYLSSGDRESFQRFVFNTLDKIIWLINEMERYEDVLVNEINVLREILNLAELVSNKLDKPRKGIINGSKGGIYVDTRTSLYEDPTSDTGDHSS